MQKIDNKVVLITGASSGIGEATAKLLASHGAKVVLGARRKDRLEKITEDIRNAGYDAVHEVIDVTKYEDMLRLVKTALDVYGKVDVLFNNAGIMLLSPVHELRVDEWEKMIDINIKGVLYGMAAVLPVMREQNYGLIINTNSTAGYRVMENSAVYSGTKFAVRAISDGLRKEESTDKNIRVTNVAPGPVDTELVSHISDMELRKELSEFTKTKGLSAEDVAQAVLFAMSQPEGSSIDEIIISPTKKINK